MGRQLKKEEWLEIFNLYEQYINYDITKKNLCLNIYKWQRKIFFIWNTAFRLIKTKFNNYNLGINIESRTEKVLKK